MSYLYLSLEIINDGISFVCNGLVVHPLLPQLPRRIPTGSGKIKMQQWKLSRRPSTGRKTRQDVAKVFAGSHMARFERASATENFLEYVLDRKGGHRKGGSNVDKEGGCKAHTTDKDLQDEVAEEQILGQRVLESSGNLELASIAFDAHWTAGSRY